MRRIGAISTAINRHSNGKPRAARGSRGSAGADFGRIVAIPNK